MPKEINLLPKKNVGFFEQEKTIMAVRVLSIVSMFLVGVSCLAVILIQKNFSLDAVDNQQASVRAKLSLLQSKTSKQFSLVDRASKIEKILKQRNDLEAKIVSIQQVTPANVTIDSFSVTATSLNLSVTSPSLSSLQSFLDDLTEKVTSKTFLKKLTINNVVLNQQTGNYSVSIQGDFL